MANLLGFSAKKTDHYELTEETASEQGDGNGGSDSGGSRFMVSNVNPAFEPDDDSGNDSSPSPTTTASPTNNAGAGNNHQLLGVPGSGGGEYNEHHTTYIKTLQRLTREVLPNMDLYRDVRSVHRLRRPSLDELHNETVEGKKIPQAPAADEQGAGVKFGWITGVMVRCLLNIWGPIMFLRLTYIVGQCGIIQTLIIIALSDVITVVTGLSISAISTNGMVKGGGTYYLISRSLGPEYGGAIGLLFAFANAVAVAMHTVGFAESMKDLLKKEGLSIVDQGVNDMRIIGVITVCLLVTITIVGMEWEQKAQLVLLVILLAAITNVVVGSFMPESEKEAKGFVGWSGTVAAKNLDSDYRKGESFFSMFSVFFPSCTGILAGANISGDLRDPSVAIPKGTLLAILFSSTTYVMFVIITGFTMMRDATGNVAQFEKWNYNFLNYHNVTYFGNPAFNVSNCGEECQYGTQNDYQVMSLIAAFGYLIYAGCFAATLSSALACLVSAPKIFQALANDKLYPKIEWFGKGFGKNNEPVRSYLLAFAVAVVFIIVADLNFIAPIISNFFMAAYCLINFACFHAALAKSPGFRPGFRYWNMWVSLVGALLSMAVMFVMNWPTALGTFFICFALYMYLNHMKPDVNWGSSRQAVSYRSALKAVQELVQVEDHVKNYRPQILALTGKVWSRPSLVDFAYQITKGIGLVVCGDVEKNGSTSYHQRAEITKKSYAWFNKRKVKGFHCLVEDDTMAHGAKALIQAAGVGKLRPNMMIMGFMNNWHNGSPDEILDYFNTLHAAFDLHLAVGILRVEQGLDFSFFTEEKTPSSPPTNGLANGHPPMKREESSASLASMTSSSSTLSADSTNNPVNANPEGKKNKKNKKQVEEIPAVEIPKEIQNSIDLFRSKPQNKNKGTIDVWWLYDDGGLTLLIPYILTTRKHWQNEKLRVFSLANKNEELDQQQLNLASLLSRFRIDCQDVTVLPDITKKPKDHSIREFELSIGKFRQQEEDDEKELNGITISENEYHTLKQKTNRYIRIRELLLQHSRNAKLVVVTMPMPRKNRVSAPMYLAWLDTLSRDLPPTVLIRGNQTSVLTFYS